ncbi:hypothetical protein V3473_31445, partial [Pseudomonas aeruginosa]|uniref:endonuclease/exonuclease/phosphatase family protein n=1 Tax=Pseudomonas aeruginosa TaxID=287 RepID=UPI002FB1B980
VRRIRPVDLTIGAREPRGALDADLAVGGATVRVVVAHLGLDPWERKHQISRILDHLADGEAPRPTIFMGDLNEWRPNS